MEVLKYMDFEISRKTLSARVTGQAKLRGDNDDQVFKQRVKAQVLHERYCFDFLFSETWAIIARMKDDSFNVNSRPIW